MLVRYVKITMTLAVAAFCSKSPAEAMEVDRSRPVPRDDRANDAGSIWSKAFRIGSEINPLAAIERIRSRQIPQSIRQARSPVAAAGRANHKKANTGRA